MVPSTSPGGTLTTPIISPVKVRTLTRMLKPSPKNALVSPRVHQGMAVAGVGVSGAAGGSVTSVDTGGVLSGGVRGELVQCRDDGGRVGDPPEDAPLGCDH